MQEKNYQLAICAVFQDEAFFLKEWIEFHKLVGVEHFYLYNNSSQDDYAKILEPYIAAKEVDLFDLPGKVSNQNDYLTTKQIPAYNEALSIAQQTSQWMAFIDLDEFIVPVKGNNLVDLLADYLDYAGVAVNWLVYGTSDVEELDSEDLITESLVWRSREELGMNEFVKYIVQPTLVEQINGPHFITCKEGYVAVDSHKNPIGKEWRHPIQTDVMRINHYWFGTHKWFVNAKLPRRAAWKVEFPGELLPALINSFNQVKDETMQRFIPLLRQRMFRQKNGKETKS